MTDRPRETGLVGAGAMGTIIARAINNGECPGSRLRAINDIDMTRARRLADSRDCDAQVLSIESLVECSDLIVEAAGPGAVEDLLPRIIERGKDLVVLSVGALIGREEQLRAAEASGSKVYCPSGAIAGLDAVRAGARGRIEGARITTRKPPSGLAGAPYFAERGMNPASLVQPTLIFEGSARDACRLFPANVNVSASLSLAGIGVDRTEVRIIADPTIQRNVHTVEVWGDFGRIETVTENVPSENPKTSRLAALSAIALLGRLSAPIQIGT